jgi:endonuclease III
MTRNERYSRVLKYFTTHEPHPETELKYSTPFQLLVAVILSAQCTDKRVNETTPALFRDYPTAEALAETTPETIFSYIRSISYPNNKARHLVNMARMLLKDYNGKVPSEVDDLVKLPGVGRKTANVIANVIFDKPAMPVDTHVFRVSNRLGLTINAKNPLQSEKQLIKFIPEQLVSRAHHWLILHGRYVCVAREPKCMICPLTAFCKYFEKNNIKKNKITNIKHQIKQTSYGKENTKKSGQETREKNSKESGKKERF